MNKEEIEKAKQCLNEIIQNTYAEGKAKKLDTLRKYIKELEEEKKVMCEEYCPKTVTYRNSIPKQKVKDEIETLRKMLKATMEGKLQKYTPNEIIIKTNTLEELLEDK